MEDEKEFNILEKAILDWIAENSKDPNIIAQIKAARFINREYTGVGFLVRLSVSQELNPIDSTKERSVLDGPCLESEDIEFGGGSLIFCERGYLATLEMYTNGSSFKEDISRFKLLPKSSTSDSVTKIFN